MERDHVESIAGAGLILAAFLQPPHRFGVTDISRRTGLTKNRSFRILQTLLEQNIVVKDASTKEYALGFRLIELGATATRSFRLTKVATPVLDRIEAEIDETVNLVIRADGYSTMCLARREARSAHKIRDGGIGARFHLHAGASSKLLLAHSHDELIESYIRLHSPLRAYTPYTITDPDRLRAELAKIRLQGYSIADQELSLGWWVIAFPVRNTNDDVIASLSITVASTADNERRKKIFNVAKSASEEISALLASSRNFTEPLLLSG